MTVTLPGIHAHHLAELVQRWHVDQDELFEGLGIDAESLRLPETQLPLERYQALIARARGLTGEPALGVYFGFDMRISAHGLLGFAAFTSATVREALTLASRFVPTKTTAISLRLVEGETHAALIIDECVDLGEARDVILFALAVGIWQLGNAATGTQIVGSAEFPFPRPAYVDRLRTLDLPIVRFDAPTTRLVCDRTVLDLPLQLADPAALEAARAHCERELAALGFGEAVVPRVRAALPLPDGGYRGIDEVARSLAMSPRTLKRRLSAEGTTFSVVLDEVRFETSVLLLRNPERSLDEIAARIGYSDGKAFSKAFRRWSGVSPGEFRPKE